MSLDTGQSHYSRVSHVSLRLSSHKYVQRDQVAVGRGVGVGKAGLPDGAPSPVGKMDMREVHEVKADPVVREMHRVPWEHEPGGGGRGSG